MLNAKICLPTKGKTGIRPQAKAPWNIRGFHFMPMHEQIIIIRSLTHRNCTLDDKNRESCHDLSFSKPFFKQACEGNYYKGLSMFVPYVPIPHLQHNAGRLGQFCFAESCIVIQYIRLQVTYVCKRVTIFVTR